MAAFVVHSIRTREKPLLNVRVLRIRSYAAAATVLFLAGLSLYGPLLLLALYYQQIQGKSAILTGLILAPQGIGSLVPRTTAGKLTDRIGPRLVVVTGLLLTIAGTFAFTKAGPASNEWLLAVSLLVRGVGLAGVTIAVMAGAFQKVPKDEVPDASSPQGSCCKSAARSAQPCSPSFLRTSSATVPQRQPRTPWPSTPRSGGRSASACWPCCQPSCCPA